LQCIYVEEYFLKSADSQIAGLRNTEYCDARDFCGVQNPSSKVVPWKDDHIEALSLQKEWF